MIYKKSWKYTLIKYSDLHYRLKALKKFKNIKIGDLGGYVRGFHNLSQTGDCWIYDFANVSGNARISENATVSDKARVTGDAKVSGDAKVYGNAKIYGSATITGNVQVLGIAQVSGNVYICKDVIIKDKILT